ncbi:MAG TPA: type I DNA topoisomerase [Firmicutes bacterium]|jgi:DNA topoisomerase-1|nr:type I DNA topoisomerase [Bacillota bacterium]
MNLVIVESPAKARTISKFLGSKYLVKASIGHLIDLPKSRLGIDIENDFNPKYITIRGKGKILNELKEASKKAEKVFLATDPDREGEAISWHLSNSLGIGEDDPCRVEFHEITKTAVKNAFAKPRPINRHRIEAQQARRILDRLVGYLISPLLWENVRKGLSAGRVQSVAVRLICDREKEIESFIPEEYWSIEGVFKGSDNNSIFSAKFYGKDGEKIDLKSEEEVNKILASIEGLNYKVKKIQVQERKRNPAPPFTTSTLQQEASRKLGFTTKKTMMLAQQLYEGLPIGEKGDAVGLITYIRTDAVSVSPLAQEEAREYIHEKYGDKFLPDKPRKFTSKKGAQEAHEAIRPTSVFRSPDVIKKYLKRDQFRLYKLIWERFLASLMETALIEQIRADISVGDYIFRASGSSVKFPGFMVLYIEGEDEEKEKEKQLPPLEEGQTLKLISLTPDQHFTQPPPRFTEASLVKTLENKGIGRPSTYSPTIDTIQSRGYVIKENKALKPTELGFIIVDILKNFFPEIIDEDFTAQLEDKLDKVESGEESRLKILNEFYIPFKNRLQVAKNEMKKIEIQDEETDEVCPHCGKNLVKKHGRYGPFLACPGFPECRYTMQPKKDTGVKCPLCNGSIVERRTRKGKLFYGCSSYPECRFVSWNKPLDKKCPKCGYYLVEKKYKGPYTGYRCANKECDFQEKKLENK